MTKLEELKVTLDAAADAYDAACDAAYAADAYKAAADAAYAAAYAAAYDALDAAACDALDAYDAELKKKKKENQ